MVWREAHDKDDYGKQVRLTIQVWSGVIGVQSGVIGRQSGAFRVKVREPKAKDDYKPTSTEKRRGVFYHTYGIEPQEEVDEEEKGASKSESSLVV